MRLTSVLITLAIAFSIGCTGPQSSEHLTDAEVSTVRNSVSGFMSTVASGVTQKGPIAWQGFLSDGPNFFMAVNGRIQFKDAGTAAVEITKLTKIIKHIELKWGDPIRIDPLSLKMAIVAAPYHEVLLDMDGNRAEEEGYFTALAEYGEMGWQFRNAHWSVAIVSPVVP